MLCFLPCIEDVKLIFSVSLSCFGMLTELINSLVSIGFAVRSKQNSLSLENLAKWYQCHHYFDTYFGFSNFRFITTLILILVSLITPQIYYHLMSHAVRPGSAPYCFHQPI